ncbi:MAG: DUF2924 domain-containing protein [Pontixanthobacter sp.]
MTNKLASLEGLRGNALDIEWRRVLRSAPPNMSADLKRRAIAYRLQEKVSGALQASVLLRLKALAVSGSAGDPCAPGCPPKPGTRFVREWNGQTLVVTKTDDAYEYDGGTYRSLSEIARKVTGTRWSGPRFFGLTSHG